ncbi:MAG: ABC transporter permease, partial [Anaerolineaceae bacterium]|nr:ABC transporter permease [Anaerolineaceae bacterium]
MKSIVKSYEFLLFLMLIVLTIIIGLVNPAFFSVGTLFDAIRIQEIYILMAFGLLPVIILGGVDISFVAIAALATYPVHMYLLKTTYTGGVWLYYTLAILIGILTGLVIGWLLTTFKISIFDLSLGMNSLIFGFVTFFVGSLTNFDMDTGLAYWNHKYIITVQSVVGQSGLHVSFLAILVTGVLLHLFLQYTTLGRAIYAFGSNKSVAIRTGFNIRKVYMTVFLIMGALSGIAGMTYCGLEANFRPYLFMGKNMQVLAAVVLGGASTRGGKGTVIGTFLGTLLIGLVNQALVYLGISTKWYDAV